MNTKTIMFENRSWITGATSVCPLGNTPDKAVDSILADEKAFTTEHRYQHLIRQPCAQIVSGNQGESTQTDFNTDDFLVRISDNCLSQLLTETRVLERYQPSEVGLFLGTTTMGIFASLQQFGLATNAKAESFYLSATMQQNTLLERLLDRHPIRGFSEIYSTACSSGALAILQGHDAVRSGMLKACIAGGFDVLTPVTLAGFSSLQVISSVPAVPFSKSCEGVTLSEGGGLILIEKQPGMNPFGSILGGASGSECWHLTQPEPNGLGMVRTMEAALNEAKVTPDQISYINAHGTGTPANDKAESRAIKKLFEPTIPYHSTKQWHGHTLAGSGALETVMTLKLLQRPESLGVLLPGFDGRRRKPLALTNSFGFGGSNVSLVIERASYG